MSYEHFRAMRIASHGAMPSMLHGPVINNTGMTRQVRRAREREFDKCQLSIPFTTKLAMMYPGQGLFMQRTNFGRIISPGWPNERRTPRNDHSHRYASLFSVLSDAPNDQGRDG